MTYEKLGNPESIRENFMKNHIQMDEFNKEAHMWEHLKTEAEDITFERAIRKLRKMDKQLIFISECEGNNSFNNCALEDYSEDIKGFAATADADWLAEMIEYEWYNKGAMMFDGFDLGSNDILPDDLYVFDNNYDWFMIFTHESENDDEDSRICYAYNI